MLHSVEHLCLHYKISEQYLSHEVYRRLILLRIKKISDSLKVVVPWDPAIDLKKSNVKKYLSDLDMTHLKFKKGVPDPAITHITPHTKWVVSKLMTNSITGMESMVSCFRVSIEKIENLNDCLLTPEAGIDGGIGTWFPPDKIQGPHKTQISCMSEDDAITFFNMDFQTYISTIVQVNSFLRKGTKNAFQGRLSYLLDIIETD